MTNEQQQALNQIQLQQIQLPRPTWWQAQVPEIVRQQQPPPPYQDWHTQLALQNLYQQQHALSLNRRVFFEQQLHAIYPPSPASKVPDYAISGMAGGRGSGWAATRKRR